MARKAKSKRTREQTLEWFQQARFGMFIHWGVYALLGKGEWIRNVGHIPQEEYDRLPPRFTAKKFDPGAWADLAKRAGMKYMVVTTKHHDGFCMFDAHNTQWKVTNTPFGRDAIAEMVPAFERKGIPVGFYYSIMDWWHEDYLPRLAWEADQRPEEGHDVMRYIEYMREHVEQIVTEYAPAPFVLWWDGGWMNKPEALGGGETNAMARRLKPDILINDRAFTREDLVTPEQRIPPTGLFDEDGKPLVWEACITMTSHWWGYDKEETVYKSPEFLIRMLVDIVSKGGNLLLNIGPKPDGTIQKEFIDRLEAIGAWMDRYSEAIYGTTASPFNLLPFYGRVTTRGERLYVHVFEWPADGAIRLPGLRNQIKRACVVEKGRPRLAFERDGDDWVITLPDKAPDPVASVFAVDLDGPPEVEPMVLSPGEDGGIDLPVLYGFLDGPHGMRIRYEAEEGVIHAGNWINPKDSIEWTVEVPKRGDYRVWLDYRVEPGQGGSQVEFIVNGKDAPRVMPNGMIASTGAGGVEGGERQVVKTASTQGRFRRKQAAIIRLKKGANTVRVMVPTIRRQTAMDLRGIELVPVA